MSGSLANSFGQLASTFIMDAWKFTTATHTKIARPFCQRCTAQSNHFQVAVRLIRLFFSPRVWVCPEFPAPEGRRAVSSILVSTRPKDNDSSGSTGRPLVKRRIVPNGDRTPNGGLSIPFSIC